MKSINNKIDSEIWDKAREKITKETSHRVRDRVTQKVIRQVVEIWNLRNLSVGLM